MAATDDFFRSQYAGLRKFAGTMGDKIGFGAGGPSPDLDPLDPPRRAPPGNPSSAFGEFDTPAPRASRTSRVGAQLGKSPFGQAAKVGAKVLGGAAKAVAPVARAIAPAARLLPGLGAGLGAYNIATEGLNPQNAADTAAGFLPPMAGLAVQAGNYALSNDNRHRTAIGQALDPVLDFMAERKSGITVGPGGATADNRPGAEQPTPAGASLNPRSQQVMTGRSNAEGDTLNGQTIPTQNIGPDGVTRGAPQTPQGLIDGSGVPVRGTGAFQVTGADGQVHPAQGVDLRSQQVQAPQAYESAQAHDDRLFGPKEGGNPVPNAQPGVFGEIAAMAGLRSRHAAARIAQSQGNRNADRAVKIRGQDTVAAAAGTRNSIAAATELRARGDATRAVNNSTIEDQARQSISQKDTGDDYEPAVKQRTAQMKSAYRFSLSDRKGESRMSLADAPPAELSRLKVLWDVKQRQKKGDTKFWEGMKELIGTKRFESRNLYDSMPVAISKGRVLHADGNETEASRVINNLLNFITPNDPADVQVQDMLRKLPTIEDYNAKNAKKGR